jgi:heat shock protein HslJ
MSARGKRLGAGVLALSLVLVAAACGDDDSDAGPGSSATPRRLERDQWVLSDATDLGAPTEGVTVTADFARGRVRGTSGCNTYDAPFSVDGDSMEIGSDIVSTKRACDADATAVESAYLARLPRVRSYRISGTTLTLKGSDGDPLLVFGGSSGQNAIEGRWDVTSFFTGDAIESVAPGSALTVIFEAGALSGDSGCNSYRAGYEISGDEITITPIASTLRACAEPAHQTQEQQYLSALQNAVSFRATPDELTLFRDDGGIAVTAQRSAAGAGR